MEVGELDVDVSVGGQPKGSSLWINIEPKVQHGTFLEILTFNEI